MAGVPAEQQSAAWLRRIRSFGTVPMKLTHGTRAGMNHKLLECCGGLAVLLDMYIIVFYYHTDCCSLEIYMLSFASFSWRSVSLFFFFPLHCLNSFRLQQEISPSHFQTVPLSNFASPELGACWTVNEGAKAYLTFGGCRRLHSLYGLLDRTTGVAYCMVC